MVKIIGYEPPDEKLSEKELAKKEAIEKARKQLLEEKQTFVGIRRMKSGWAVIKEGKWVAEFHGPGSKLKAIERAGTNCIWNF